jgi:hypothetical protein
MSKFFFEPSFSLFFVISMCALLAVILVNQYSIFWLLLLAPISFVDIVEQEWKDPR